MGCLARDMTLQLCDGRLDLVSYSVQDTCLVNVCRTKLNR